MRFDRAGDGFRVALESGAHVDADGCVVAVGHERPRLPDFIPPDVAASSHYLNDPWRLDAQAALALEGDILLIGSALTAADVLATLVRRTHAGRITVLSRHGYRPADQNPSPSSRSLWDTVNDPVPDFVARHGTPARVSEIVRILRANIEGNRREGRTWHGAFDEVRNAASPLWSALPGQEKRRFLRHLRAPYDPHRFRLPPQTGEILDRALANGRLSILAGGSRGSIGETPAVPLITSQVLALVPACSVDCAREADYSAGRGGRLSSSRNQGAAVVANPYESIEVKPLTPAMGAQVLGVDLGKPLDERQWKDVHQAFLDHLVLVFADQHLSPEQQIAFGRRFGTLNVHPYVKALEGYPEILDVRKEPRDETNFGGAWHADLTFLEQPPLGSVLYSREVPEVGGDTMWCNLYLAYESLSEGMKKLLEGLIGVHSAVMLYGSSKVGGTGFGGRMSMQIDQKDQAAEEVEHPLVRTHPETGRKLLSISPGYLRRFKDMSEQESAPLLDQLKRHALQEVFTFRFRWTKDTVALWDNRCTLHYALNDYHGSRRRMLRVAINGDRPR
jgi:alpha-ketoglutarate-dependent taurine dioxygenase